MVGAGGLGSAVLYHLARRGRRALGLDRYTPPHEFGSSHGHTRIYRQAYSEGPEYVPLALRSLALWRSLEQDAGEKLFDAVGALTIGPETGALVAGVLRSAREYSITHEVLSGDDVRRRFPVFNPPAGTIAVYEPGAGILFPERCIRAHLRLARAHGAELHFAEKVQHIESQGDDVRVVTDTGAYAARRVVLCAGAWGPRLAGLDHAFTVTRETVHWFTPRSPSSAARVCPVSMVDLGSGPYLYTVPDSGAGFKAGLHHTGAVVEPEAASPATFDAEREAVLAVLSRVAPGGVGPARASAGCYYTSTADQHFAIGRLAATPGLILASACSGHGFKFTSALGADVAALASGDEPELHPRFDVGRLSD